MPTYTEKLPERKSSKHSGIRWTPLSGENLAPGGLLTIDTDRSRVEYTLTEFPIDWPGRGFHLCKLDAGTDTESERYNVFCSKFTTAADTCDCKGFAYKRHCKHVDACRALLENRWL